MNSDGSIKERHTFERNTNGKILEEAFYDTSGELKWKHQFKYDSAGNNIEYTEVDLACVLISKATHTFNVKGNATQTTIYDANSHVSSSTIFKYDDNGEHLIEQSVFDSKGNLQTRNVLKRDAKGFVVEDDEFDSKDETTRQTRSVYEFYH